MSLLGAGSVVCPMCTAENRRGTARCFLCGQSLSGATEFVPSKPSAGRQTTFRITSIMLLIALIAVVLGVFREAPGLAIPLAVAGTIALMRTIVFAAGRPGPPSVFDHMAVFLGTFVAVVVVAIAAVVSFFMTCLAVASGSKDLGAGLMIGGIVGVAVLIGLAAAFVRWGKWAR
jgi:hypothetical protein